ncbi:MAG: TetR/AcrR family transcriptional regulator [Proteobacteria bacterium]|nr:TetR/AcrR family transcriptional regulator [Pseudomonadota bacterium]
MSPGSSSTLQEVRRQAYQQMILDAAERVFADHGFEAAKIQIIADVAGVSVGTIYSVFGSKSELFSTVLTRRLPDLLELSTLASQKGDTPFESLIEGLDAYIVYLLEHPDYLRIHLGEHAWGLGPTRASAEQLTAWRQGLAMETVILKGAMEEGLVIEDDPERLARCVTAIHQVQLWDWVEKGMEEPPEEVAPRIRKLIVQMLCVDKPKE